MVDDGGIGRLQKRLAAIPVAVREAAEKTLVVQASRVADTMRLMAPDDPATSEPDLKSSIEVTPAGRMTPPYSQPGGSMVVPELTVAITVGNEDVRYPHLQEYGTTRHPAQPFFWPAFRLHRNKVSRAIKAGIGRAVRKNWGKA